MVVDNLINELSKLGYPVKKQGSLLPDEAYPDHFFTYWNNSADGDSYYCNDESAVIWNYSINFYSVDELLVDSKLLEAKKLLKDAGFVVTGAGYDVASDEVTHSGRGIIALYREQL
jgi:hypothetical protein